MSFSDFVRTGEKQWGFLCVCVQATLKPGRPATEVALQAWASQAEVKWWS